MPEKISNIINVLAESIKPVSGKKQVKRTKREKNCRSGVFVGYLIDKGYGLLSGRLYMPEVWFSEEYDERREKTMVPEGLVFNTKPEIATELIKDVVASGRFPAKWLGCVATFGSDTRFLNSLPGNMSYFASIKSDTMVFVRKPKTGIPPYKGRGPRPKKVRVPPGEPSPINVDDLAGNGQLEWRKAVLAEGSKGPITAEAARLRVYRSKDGLPEENPVWLFARRDEDGRTRFALSNAQEDIAFDDLCEASTMRWPIEQCFREGKEQIGMGHYEHRSWPAWHRHMVFVFLGLHFLLRLRINLKKSLLPDGAQARMIVAEILELKKEDKTTLLERLRYYTKRNYVAQKSHRKKKVEMAERLGINVAL